MADYLLNWNSHTWASLIITTASLKKKFTIVEKDKNNF